ncbi:hypothetical protein [Paenibacillus polysaccharolyticus]|uniref:hypothetical protein n=1 Tax=Paenibacillus polysaccharolyticus TaxID=582692 RepID=UPI00280BC679|nr:hypothetical protein [Paenibacillus polysaccharolyticus]
MIQSGDVLELRGGKALKVLSGHTDSLVEGHLVVVEIDEDNNEISDPIDFKITPSTPIIDIIR